MVQEKVQMKKTTEGKVVLEAKSKEQPRLQKGKMVRRFCHVETITLAKTIGEKLEGLSRV